MKPMSYHVAIHFFNQEWVTISTLGRRSEIKVCVNDNHILVQNSGSNILSINEQHWNAVMERIAQLPPEERERTSRYIQGTQPHNWEKCPNRIFSPYIPAVVRYINEGKKE